MYRRVSIVEIPEETGNEAAALRRESEKILLSIQPKSYVAAMCIEAKPTSSEEFARIIASAAQSHPHLTIIIGSSHGLGDAVKEASDIKISLGKITLPHSLARVMTMEQVYRAFTIINNTKYHK